MHSVSFSKTGGPEGLEYEELKLEDPKSGEVLIKHSAIGLNFIDTYHRSGLYPVPLPSGTVSYTHLTLPTKRIV